MNPENCADELDRIARILIAETTEESFLLDNDERQHYHRQLDSLLHRNVTYAAVVCLAQQTREFLLAYTDGIRELQSIHSVLESAG